MIRREPTASGRNLGFTEGGTNSVTGPSLRFEQPPCPIPAGTTCSNGWRWTPVLKISESKLEPPRVRLVAPAHPTFLIHNSSRCWTRVVCPVPNRTLCPPLHRPCESLAQHLDPFIPLSTGTTPPDSCPVDISSPAPVSPQGLPKIFRPPLWAIHIYSSERFQFSSSDLALEYNK
jgi:hypothetical protein